MKDILERTDLVELTRDCDNLMNYFRTRGQDDELTQSAMRVCFFVAKVKKQIEYIDLTVQMIRANEKV